MMFKNLQSFIWCGECAICQVHEHSWQHSSLDQFELYVVPEQSMANLAFRYNQSRKADEINRAFPLLTDEIILAAYQK